MGTTVKREGSKGRREETEDYKVRLQNKSKEELVDLLLESETHLEETEEHAQKLSKNLGELQNYLTTVIRPPFQIFTAVEYYQSEELPGVGKIEGIVVADPRREDAVVGVYSPFFLTKEEKESIKPGTQVLVGKVANPNNPMDQFDVIIRTFKEKPDIAKGTVTAIIKGKGDKWKAEVTIGPNNAKNITFDPKKIKLKVNQQVELLGGEILATYDSPDSERFKIVDNFGVKWEDIGGLKSEKKELFKTFMVPYLLNNEGPKKVLLYGVPGGGKTLLALGLASNLPDCGFMRISGPEVETMWVGETPRLIRGIFSTCNQKLQDGEYKHMVLIIDEIDAVMLARDSSEASLHGGAASTTGQILSSLDGMYKMHPNFRVIMTTNRPWALDPGMFRQGRIDKMVDVQRPRSIDDLAEICGVYARVYKTSVDKKLVGDAGGNEQQALEKLVSEFSNNTLFSNAKVQTMSGQALEAKEINTGAFIAGIFSTAVEEVNYDKALLTLDMGLSLNEVAKKAFAAGLTSDMLAADKERLSGVKEKYRHPDEIGLNMEYLQSAYDKLKKDAATAVYAYMAQEAQFKAKVAETGNYLL